MSSETAPDDAHAAKAGQGKSAPAKRAWIMIVTWVRQEPAATQALIQVFLALGIAFQWWHWSDAQTGAVVGIAAALLGMFVRSQVMPLVQPTAQGRLLVPARAVLFAGSTVVIALLGILVLGLGS
jgi:hypothetical protein